MRSRVLVMSVLGVVVASACSEASGPTSSLVNASAADVRTSQLLPAGAHFETSPPPTIDLSQELDRVVLTFAAKGLGGASSRNLEVFADIRVKVIVECTKTISGRIVDRTLVSDRVIPITGSQSFPINRNGSVVGQIQLNRGNGQAGAINVCNGWDSAEVVGFQALGNSETSRIYMQDVPGARHNHPLEYIFPLNN